MENRIRELFATMLQVPVEQITDDTDPSRLDRWDSMQHMMLISGFEEELGLELDPEEAIEMYKDFATFKRIVLQKLALQK